MVSVCNDIVVTFCSSERVSNLMQDALTATPTATSRVETWSNALKTAVDKLHAEFPSLEDVVKPFTTGLLQVSSTWNKKPACVKYLVLFATLFTDAGRRYLSRFPSYDHFFSKCKLVVCYGVRGNYSTFHQFKLLPVLRDISQFPFFTSKNGCGSAAFILSLLDSLKVISEGMCQNFHLTKIRQLIKIMPWFFSNCQHAWHLVLILMNMVTSPSIWYTWRLLMK